MTQDLKSHEDVHHNLALLLSHLRDVIDVVEKIIIRLISTIHIQNNTIAL